VFAGRYADSMFRLGVSPRGSALGNAAGALLKDGAAFLDNPANISYLNTLNVRALYISQFGMADYNYLGIAIPIMPSVVTEINWMHFGVDNIPLHPDLSGFSILTQRDSARVLSNDGLGTFADREDAVFLSLAKMSRWNLNLGYRYFSIPVETPIGINIKYLNRQVYNVKGAGIGVDLSMAFRFSVAQLLDIKSLGDFGIALLAQDLTGTPVSWNTRSQDVIHPALQWNWVYQQPVKWHNSQVNFVYKTTSRYQGGTGWGIEWFIRQRFGIQIGANSGQFSAGMTVNTTVFSFPISIEYAFSRHDLGMTHRLGINWKMK